MDMMKANMVLVEVTKMSFKEFINEQDKKEEEDKIMGAIVEYFSTHEKPNDEEIHKMAEELGIEPDELENKIYSFLTDFFNAGRYKENPLTEIDEDQLKRGIEVEMEHSRNKAIARRISLDHMAEFPGKDYYKALKDMEEKLK